MWIRQTINCASPNAVESVEINNHSKYIYNKKNLHNNLLLGNKKVRFENTVRHFSPEL